MPGQPIRALAQVVAHNIGKPRVKEAGTRPGRWQEGGVGLTLHRVGLDFLFVLLSTTSYVSLIESRDQHSGSLKRKRDRFAGWLLTFCKCVTELMQKGPSG
jgi:hypothetical protein